MKVVGLQTQIWDNNIKSLFLLILFPILLALILLAIIFSFVLVSKSENVLGDLVIYYLLSLFIMIPCVLIWFGISLAFNQQIINWMTGAKYVDRLTNPKIYNIVENLCISRGLVTPKIQIIEDSSLNAFASGLTPTSSTITFTRGLIDKLNDKEIEAVAAHELTHIINLDIRLMVVSVIFVGIIQTLADFFLRVRFSSKSEKNDAGAIILILKLVVFILAFFISIVIQFAISRKREFLADAGSVELTKSSEHLISALEKIDGDPFVEAVQNRNIAQMFIDNPTKAQLDEEGKRKVGFIDKLFMSHPPMEERIKALRMIG